MAGAWERLGRIFDGDSYLFLFDKFFRVDREFVKRWSIVE